jgi:D-lactate dehydrogenase
MKVAVFSTKAYDRKFLEATNASRHELQFFEPRFSGETASVAGKAFEVDPPQRIRLESRNH